MQTESTTPPLVVFIGPSGAGKSTAVRLLAERGLIALTPTWTDRPPRLGEAEIEHKFISSEEFDQKVRQGFFIHPPLTFFGVPYRYATPPLIEPAKGQVRALM
jgi:guanylate kinase